VCDYNIIAINKQLFYRCWFHKKSDSVRDDNQVDVR